jgi:hypothetical protein
MTPTELRRSLSSTIGYAAAESCRGQHEDASIGFITSLQYLIFFSSFLIYATIHLARRSIQWFLEAFKYTRHRIRAVMWADMSAARLSAHSPTIVPHVGHRAAQRQVPYPHYSRSFCCKPGYAAVKGSLAVQPFDILLGTGTAADGRASPRPPSVRLASRLHAFATDLHE